MSEIETTNKLETDDAQKVIQATEGPLKQMLVEYVGKVLRPEDEQVTVEMIVQTLASEFPEFLLVVARENWIRGYEQALADVENVEKERIAAMQEQAERIKGPEEKRIEAKHKKPKKEAKKTKKDKDERISKAI